MKGIPIESMIALHAGSTLRLERWSDVQGEYPNLTHSNRWLLYNENVAIEGWSISRAIRPAEVKALMCWFYIHRWVSGVRRVFDWCGMGGAWKAPKNAKVQRLLLRLLHFIPKRKSRSGLLTLDRKPDLFLQELSRLELDQGRKWSFVWAFHPLGESPPIIEKIEALLLD